MTSDLLLKMDHTQIRFHDVDLDLVRNRPTPIDFNVLPAKTFTTTYPASQADAALWQAEHPTEPALDVRAPETSALTHIFKTQGYTEVARNDAYAVLGGFCIPLATKMDLAADAPIHAARTMLYIFGAGGTGKSEVFKMITSGTPEALVANFPGADRNYPASEVYDCRDTAVYLTNSDLSTDPTTHASLDMLKKTALGETQSITARTGRACHTPTSRLTSFLLPTRPSRWQTKPIAGPLHAASASSASPSLSIVTIWTCGWPVSWRPHTETVSSPPFGPTSPKCRS